MDSNFWVDWESCSVEWAELLASIGKRCWGYEVLDFVEWNKLGLQVQRAVCDSLFRLGSLWMQVIQLSPVV